MSFTSQRRQDRVRVALDQRLGSVVAVAEAVYRRHNVSAILRSAECFGLHDVHLVSGGFKPTKGAARGSERWLDLHMHPDIDSCTSALKAQGFKLWVADLAPDALSPDEVPVDEPVAVLFGAELTGVSDRARELADGVVSVPMLGLTESLNVSVAAAIVLQRLSARRRALVGPDLPRERREAFFADWLEREEQLRVGVRARTDS